MRGSTRSAAAHHQNERTGTVPHTANLVCLTTIAGLHARESVVFGTLRLVLAAMVAASHLGINLPDIWLGVVAVVVFFMLSGFAMTGLLYERFDGPQFSPNFYLERFIRLAPQYYLWLGIASILALFLQWNSVKMEGFLPYGLLAYLTVIPLGLQQYLGPVDTLILPQATTLGIEITLYIFSPWILKNRLLSWAIATLCLAIFLATALGALSSNTYTYYNAPAPMIFYLLGSFIYKRDWQSMSFFSAALLGILLLGLPQRFNPEFISGLTLGIPLLVVLASYKSSRTDTALGNASYGCFLGHSVVFVVTKHITGTQILPLSVKLFAIAVACVIGYLSFLLVEKPTVPWRKRLRSSTSPLN
jgi:peptidoglycan/LPS O-acetylase OafA/YrhL